MGRLEIVKGVAYAVIFVSLLVMFGWLFNISLLKSINGLWPNMTFISASCFFFSGFVLYGISKFVFGNRSDNNQIFIFFLTIILLLVLATYIISFELNSSGIEYFELDGSVFRDLGIPSVGSIYGFVIIILASLSVLFKRYKNMLMFCGLLLFLLGLIAIFGYLLGDPRLYYSFPSLNNHYLLGMAFRSSILFILQGVAYILLGMEVRKNENNI